MSNVVMWEMFIASTGVGILGSILTWRPANITKSSVRVSLLPGFFLALGTAPSVFSEGHGIVIMPAAFQLPLMLFSPLLILLPMTVAFLGWWFLLTKLSKRWRRNRGLA